MKQYFTFFFLTIALFWVTNGFSQPLPCPPANTTSITAHNTFPVCSGGCTHVYATDTTTLKSTTGYTVTDIPYLPTSYTTGTPILVGIDDIWSEPLDIPFPFCFWGTKYNQCLIGANGQIGFDLTQAGLYDPYPISLPLPAGNNTGTLNTIMGAYYDIDPGIGGNIAWAIYGTAPCRTFVVSWSDVPLFDATICPGLYGTEQIVLYESTYAIDVFIQNRPICTGWNDGKAILGIEDQSGTNYVLYPGYNATAWSATNFACRFTPNGPASWTYKWTDPSGAVVGTSDTATVCPTSPTWYYVRGVASSNCDSFIVNDSVQVLVGPSPVISAITHTSPSYCGATDGTITLYGLAPAASDTVFYTFNGVPQAPIPTGVGSAGTITLGGLSAGVYTNIYVKVGPCVSNIVTATLVNPPPPVVTVDSALVKTCVGVPVLLHATSVPGGTSYNYTWTPPTDLSSSTVWDPTVTPSAPGNITYTVTVYPTFNPSCFSTDTVHVHTVPNDFVLNNVDTPICLGNFVQGSITGSPEFSYLWIPPTGVSNTTIRNPTLTPTGTTTYIATANYAHCPEMYHSFTIEVDTLAPMLSYLDTICLGMHDTFSVAVAGPDTGSNYYHYQWGTSPDISNDTIPNPVITPGGVGTNVYTVNIHPHALGCAVTDVVTIYVLPNSISVSPIDTAICFGQVVQVVGTGNSNFTYQWIPTAGIASYTSISPLITPDTSALYTVTASFHRCPDMYATLNLNVQPNPSVYIGGNRFLCEYDTLHLNASVSPAWYGSYIYTWTPAANLDNNTTSTVVFSGLNTANLHLVVTTSAGCTSNDSALITVIPGNFATILPDTDFCPHDSMMLVPVSSVPGVTYHWYPAYYLSDSLGSNPVIKPISTQTYTIVATADGCKDTITFTATVHPAAVLIIPDSVTITPGESYSIEPSTNCTNFAWFPPAGLNATTISNPVARPDISTEYYVTATTDWGCITRDSITINIDGSSSIAMPNAFTPGNGVNNEFKVIMKGITSLNHFRIYNRWGNLLFETTSLDQGWDGTYKGQPQPFGVYVYEIEAVSTSGAILNKVGNITLLR